MCPPRLRHGRVWCASWLAAALVSCLLAACGGGGGGSAAGGTPSAPPVVLPAVDVSAVRAADPGSSLPEGWQHGAVAQIFVRSYQDSDGDGIGDLRGLISRLDYLRDLGVKALWLMPVTRSQDRDHGYAVADYRAIEADYGSLADLDALVAAAHARGLGVILDYVMNHSAAQHPLFVNAASGAANAWRDWYVWSASHPASWNVFGVDPWRASAAAAVTSWYYAPFWDQMPDFNLRHPAVVEFHRDNLRFWLNRGVDGFRFDAVGMLFENGPAAWESQPENETLMRDLAALVGSYQRRHLVCEAPAQPDRLAAACGSAFAFGRQATFLGAARGVAADMRAVVDYPLGHPATLASLLANHDSFAGARVWDQLQGDQAAYRLAAALYLLQPGTPYIYYGEEIGM
ncbi:MAG: hypothetical protein RLY71_4371, partial [Pseudomonadota bacterium]